MSRVCAQCAMDSDGEAVACVHMFDSPPIWPLLLLLALVIVGFLGGLILLLATGTGR